jgi:hypothetical protein
VYGLITGFLFGSCAPLALIVKRRYGHDVARKFGAGMTTALVGQQVLVGLVSERRTERDGSRHRLTLVDLITLSRGRTGAVMTGLMASGIRDRRGLAGWLGWIAMLY